MTNNVKKINNSSSSVTKILRTLYNIQLIDSRIDYIKEFRDNFPKEIKDVEKELFNIKYNLKNIHMLIDTLKKKSNQQNDNIQTYELLIKKYNKQKNKIKNSKDLYSINKEIDYQYLEIQLSKKKIKELNIKIQIQKDNLNKKEKLFKNKKKHFFHKKKELNNIISNHKKEEKILLEKILLFYKKLDNKLLKTYKKIRNKVNNGIAVSQVIKGIPIGSYLAITPQKYSDLIQRKNILIDEHSGRILIDSELAEEEKKKYIFCKNNE